MFNGVDTVYRDEKLIAPAHSLTSSFVFPTIPTNSARNLSTNYFAIILHGFKRSIIFTRVVYAEQYTGVPRDLRFARSNAR